MENPRFTEEEFDRLFPGPFPSEQARQEEYHALRCVLEEMDRAPVPELSVREKAEIFRHAWRRPSHEHSWVWTWPILLRRPAVTFALGLVLGCVAMFGWMRQPPERPAPGAAEPSLTVERTGHTETYQGQFLQRLYPRIENPKVIVEKAPEAARPQRVLQGTLDNGEIYVVWNL